MQRNRPRRVLRRSKGASGILVRRKSRLPAHHQDSVRARRLGDKLLFIITIFLVGGTIFLYSGYRLLRVYRQRLDKLKEEVRVLEEKKRELTEEIEAREDDSFYLEKLAREMGLIKDGEVIYRFREEED